MVSLVVGAGAVVNAWAPIIRAVQPYFDFELTTDSVNAYLTRIVYLCRWWETTATRGETALQSNPLFEKARKTNLYRVELAKLKQDISDAIGEALRNNEIFARKEFESIFTEFVLQKSKQFALVNTNWDTAIDYAAKRVISKHGSSDLKVVHLHGDYKNLSQMYLPSEITEEPYREFDDNQQIGTLHGAVWRNLGASETIVLYGLSLSPLDIELCQTLACGFMSTILKRILVVDPDHKTVAGRVNLLVDFRYPVSVFGCSPLDLGNLIDYSIEPERLRQRNELFKKAGF